jgi:hypothetical protein
MTIRDNGESNDPRSGRLHRENPERTEPARSAKHHLDANGGWRESLTGSVAANGDAAESADGPDTVGYGVHLGYKIIEEQILKGRKIAEQWHAPGREEKDGDEWPRVLERLLNVYRDLGSVYMDATESIISRVAKLALEYDPSTDGERHASPDTRTADIAVTVSSSKKVRIQLDLKPGLAGNLSIPPLHGLDAAAKPLTTVCFSPGMTTNLPELHVELPDDCVATTYTGVIVDADTNEPMGTLCVHVVD